MIQHDVARAKSEILDLDQGTEAGAPEYNLDELLSLPAAEQARRLGIAAEEAAPIYEADLARPLAWRDLTALSSLDGDAFHEPG
jgi:hypothetical protein